MILSRFMLDPVVKPRDDTRYSFPIHATMPPVVPPRDPVKNMRYS
ncbi:MAG: palindromic element RPE4 domain-containing protein [Rickettsia endosymbiont of Graphium doson]|nr:palindromic element RPE4 domain-containing protein [Rickettsia endosymbiont of Graphium doson]